MRGWRYFQSFLSLQSDWQGPESPRREQGLCVQVDGGRPLLVFSQAVTLPGNDTSSQGMSQIKPPSPPPASQQMTTPSFQLLIQKPWSRLWVLLLSHPPSVNKSFFFKFYLFLAALGLRCCTQAFSSCGEWGLLFVAVPGLLMLQSTGSRHVGFSSCGMWAR